MYKKTFLTINHFFILQRQVIINKEKRGGVVYMTANKYELDVSEQQQLLEILQKRFETYPERHEGIEWNSILERLQQHPQKLWVLSEMERTGGEPDVLHYDAEKDEYIFYDCAKESPKGRRSVCFDEEARLKRKKFPPEESVEKMLTEMKFELLTEEDYRFLQQFGPFDQKTSSWIQTPEKIRSLGGALFCDYRYETVFLYHNGADSYYGSRGFRGLLKV